MRTCLARAVATAVLAVVPALSAAQGANTTRLLILQAEGRRAPTSADLSAMRIGARSGNADTARVALRALGRLERASVIPDILPGLRHSLPEVRVEAANALAQAAQGLRNPAAGTGPGTGAGTVSSTLASAQSALIARLTVDTEPGVRGAVCEALARLPYTTAADAARAEAAIVTHGARATALLDRLGVAKALEAFVRTQKAAPTPGADTLAVLRQLARPESVAPGLDLSRDSRVRRLAVEALTTANALDEDAIVRAAEDADAQVRRLAMRAIGVTGLGLQKTRDGLVDVAAPVRIEALRALRLRGGEAICAAAITAATDADMHVALIAIDQLAACPSSADAVAMLVKTAGDVDDLKVARGWHRQVHAMVALATAAPEQARSLLAPFATAPIWQVRAYAARAAGQLGERNVLDTLARDADDRVADAALSALGQPLRPRTPLKTSPAPAVTAAEIRRLAAPRARIVVRDVGTIELALFTAEAPGTVVRFARLVDEGYYNGMAFDRLSPNAIVQGGDRGHDSAVLPAREVGTWPHVRGSVGVSSPDTNDAQFFVNLVDNPRFDHQYTVFGQILNGAEVVDRLLEGDVIDSITIVP